jgi:hypothetical protein
VPTVRFWRPRSYNLPLGNLEDFVNRWKRREFETGNNRGWVTEYDLIRWIIQLALTCAANIVPQSLGKANLHRISEIRYDSSGKLALVKVYSSEFDGVFTADQLLDRFNPRRIRDISLVQGGEPRSDYPAALQCVIDKRPIIQSLRQRSSHFDAPERKLGLSHVLAIPLRSDFANGIPDQPVSITVDLHYLRLIGFVTDKFKMHRTLLRRAGQLSEILLSVDAIHARAFLPPSDAPGLPVDERPGPPAEKRPGPPAEKRPGLAGRERAEREQSARPREGGDDLSAESSESEDTDNEHRRGDDPPGHYWIG